MVTRDANRLVDEVGTAAADSERVIEESRENVAGGINQAKFQVADGIQQAEIRIRDSIRCDLSHLSHVSS